MESAVEVRHLVKVFTFPVKNPDKVFFIFQETPGCGLFEERYTMRMARPRARG